MIHLHVNITDLVFWLMMLMLDTSPWPASDLAALRQGMFALCGDSEYGNIDKPTIIRGGELDFAVVV